MFNQFRRIYIKNFQSIKELELELEPNRCYHLKGKNNIGKSSILKALRAIVKNISSRDVKHYIRDGEESFYIEVEDFNHNIVRLSRGKEDYYSWIIDGKEGRVDGTAGKVPEEVKRYFNFYEDEEKTGEIVNIRPPRAKLLFVDTTFGENYYLLQKALRIEEFLAALKLGDSRRKEVKKEISLIDSRIEDEKEALRGLKDYGVLLKEIEVYENVADMYMAQIEQIEEVIDLAKRIEKKEQEIKEKTFHYDEEYVKELVKKVTELNEIVELWKKIERKERSIKRKEEVIQFFDEYRGLYESVKRGVEHKKLLEDVGNLQQKINRLEKSIKGKEKCVENWDKDKLEVMVENIKRGLEIVTEGKRLRERIYSLSKKEEQYKKLEEERKEFMVKNKFCPVVLSMSDRKCPFSGKPLEELLSGR